MLICGYLLNCGDDEQPFRSCCGVIFNTDFHGNWARIFTILCLSVLCFVLICGYFGVVAVRRVCAAVIGGGVGDYFCIFFEKVGIICYFCDV